MIYLEDKLLPSISQFGESLQKYRVSITFFLNSLKTMSIFRYIYLYLFSRKKYVQTLTRCLKAGIVDQAGLNRIVPQDVEVKVWNGQKD